MAQTAPTLVSAPRRRRISPAVALAVLSVVVAEVLSGSTHLSTLFAVIPEILVWGCGALLIREVARRKGLSGTAILLMGLALSLAEEILIQQTSLAPLPWLKGAAQLYGRAFGVSWIYLLFQLGFESVWVVVVPVQLVELIYAERRSEPWLRRRGLMITSILFLVGGRVAWYGWNKRVRPMTFHLPPYHPSPYAFLAGLAAAIVLIAVALNLGAGKPVERTAPSPIATFFIVLVLGLPWSMLLVFQLSSLPALLALPFWIPMVGGVAWGIFTYILIRLWSAAGSWDVMHRYSAVFSAMLVCMMGGLLGARAWLRMDQVAQAVFDAFAVILMIALGRSLRSNSPGHTMTSGS